MSGIHYQPEEACTEESVYGAYSVWVGTTELSILWCCRWKV